MHRLISWFRSSCATILLCTVLASLLECVALESTGNTLPTIFNSSLSCNRGLVKTKHVLDCKKELPTGLLAVIAVRRLFYGATPTLSNCHRAAPFISCCYRNPSKPDCVFESEFKLDYAASKCSGHSYCSFNGRLVSSSMGNCNRTLYPEYTSFSFIEYECISLSKLDNICPDSETVEEAPQLFLDSNNHHSNFDLRFTSCNCILFTRCGASVVFEAVYVQLKKVNVTECVEEITFQDMKDSSVNKTYTCAENKEMSNVIMFNSSSNAAMMKLDILGKHIGSLLISVTSSDPSSVVSLRCGQQVESTTTLPSKYYCPGEDTPPTPPKQDTTTTDSVNEGGSGDAQGGNPERIIIKESDDLSTGGIVGICLAVVGILLVLSQVILFLYRRHKKRNSEQDEYVVRYNNHIIPDYLSDVSVYSEPVDHPYPTANGGFDDADEGKYQTVVVPDVDNDYVDVLDEAKYSGAPPPYTEHDDDYSKAI